MEIQPIRTDDAHVFPLTDEMAAFMAKAEERRRKVTTNQTIEVRREYMQEELRPTPIYLATRLHIAELWLESRK